MKIAILYIGIGDYVMFWKEFYLSCERNFLPNCEKEYYVFTDAEIIYAEDNPAVYKFFQKNLGWPGNTLFRFNIFEREIDNYGQYDYIFFVNANAKVEREIGEEILAEKKLIVAQHPAFWSKSPNEYPYDRNKDSMAYIPYGMGTDYVMGAFNGGSSEAYIEMIRTLANNTNIDWGKNIVALWHDESHLNKYILSHSYKLLSPEYVYPQGWYRFPFECKILLRDKVICGGRRFLKNKHWSLSMQIKYYLHFLYDALREHR